MVAAIYMPSKALTFSNTTLLRVPTFSLSPFSPHNLRTTLRDLQSSKLNQHSSNLESQPTSSSSLSPIKPKMKKSGLFAASVAAASAAVSSSNHHQDGMAERGRESSSSAKANSSSSEKFAPRFDGLRFIETLVTAHR